MPNPNRQARYPSDLINQVSNNINRPVASKDRAETFDESDVTISAVGLRAGNGSVDFQPNSTDTLTPGDMGGLSYGGDAGVRINPNKKVTTLSGTTTSQEASERDVYLEDLSGTELARQDNVTAGGSFTFSGLELEAGVGYNLLCTTPGDTPYGRIGDYPVTSPTFDVIDGAGDLAAGISGTWPVFTEIVGTAEAKSGEAMIGWTNPTDIYRWDAASFQATTDGGSVDIFVEESTDGGSTWTEIQGPIERGEQIDADPESRVRFRVELSRNDTANNPTLDAIYRRWVV